MVNKNNVMAGLFLIAGLLLAVGMSFWLGEAGQFFGAKNRYVAVFDLQTGTAGLQPGSDVTLAGQSVGRVGKIRPRVAPGQDGVEVPDAIEVELVVDRSVVLFEDAYADLNAPLLGGVSSVNFSSAGTGAYEGGPADTNIVLDDGETVRGRAAPGLLAQAGIDSETVDQVKRIIANAESTSARVDEIAEAIQGEAAPGVKSAREIIENVRTFTANFNGEDKWSGKVDHVLTKAKSFSDTVEENGEAFAGVAQDFRDAIGDARDLIQVSRPRIASILANADAIVETTRFDTMPRVNTAVDTGTLALRGFGDLADRGNLILDREAPGVHRIVENARQTSEQANLMVGELRAQPWRVLSQPGKADLEREPLYSAAREYARAVSDLRSAGEALEAVVARRRPDGSARPGDPLDPARLAELRDEVDAAFDRYKTAEQALLDRLGGG